MAKVVKSTRSVTGRAVTRTINRSKAHGSTINLTSGQRKAILEKPTKDQGRSRRG